MKVGFLASGALFAAFGASACDSLPTEEPSGSGATNTTTSSPGSGEGGNSGGAGGAGGGVSSGGAGATTGTGAGSTSSTTAAECQTNADCTNNPKGPVCDWQTGLCVACLPGAAPNQDCGVGAWCNPSNNTCEAGCTGDADCQAPTSVCDVDSHTCKGCLVDVDCEFGFVCVSGECTAGCSPTQPCQLGFSCCNGSCFDLSSDENNCGGCNEVCDSVANATPLCSSGQCSNACLGNFADCNGFSSDGCEQNTLAEGPCQCVPGSTQACYLGKPGTENVGSCHAGVQTCKEDGVGWGPCLGQVLPVPEVCADGADNNCNGQVDENTDMDGDGWGICDGDCDDNRNFVNPGAMEVTFTFFDDDNDVFTPPVKVPLGNNLDDDCNPATPDIGEPPPCSSVAKFSGVTAIDLANAMELCQTALPNPPKSERTWGMISAQLLQPDGTTPSPGRLLDMQNKQSAVLADYGVNLPTVGATMVGLSTGIMRDQNDPGAVPPVPGTDFGAAGLVSPSYLDANGGNLPSANGCQGACPTGNDANDGVNLRVVVRVPTNMNALSFDFRYFTGGFPTGLCSLENDFFLALLTSADPAIPLDKNVAFDLTGGPVSMNNSFFKVCEPFGCFSCPKGKGSLAGTGMSAASDWLMVDAPVLPGEEITLDLMVFDVSTGEGDWVTLIDGFRWRFLTCCLPHP